MKDIVIRSQVESLIKNTFQMCKTGVAEDYKNILLEYIKTLAPTDCRGCAFEDAKGRCCTDCLRNFNDKWVSKGERV